MPRGKKREVGSIRIAQNGYRYIQTENGQRLLHHVLAEKKLGRALLPDERVYFADGDRTHVEVDNLDVQRAKRHTAKRLWVRIIAMEKELAYMRAELEGELGKSSEIEERERDDSLDS